jgi:hypothetical protein
MLSANFIIRTHSIGRIGWKFVESVQRNPETNFAAVGREFSKIKRVEQTNVHVSSLYALLQTTHNKTYSYTS